jgi:hypothetical protein
MIRRLSLVAVVSTLQLACGARTPLDTATTPAPPPSAASAAGAMAFPPGAAGAAAGSTGAAAGAAGSTADSPGPSSGAGGTPSGSTTDGSVGAVDAEEPPLTPPVCAATCETAFNPGNATSTAEEVRAALVGRWQFCSGGEEWLTWAPADTVGVEFTPPNGTALDGSPGGDVYFLVAPTGDAPVRGVGDSYHLRYGVGPPTQINLYLASGGGFFANPRYTTCPRQLELHLMYRPKVTMHVPLADVPSAPPICTSTTATSPPMSPADFCAIFLADCGTSYAGHATMAECEASYEAARADSPTRQACESYHLCNADRGTGAIRQVHCPHAAGLGPCAPP